LSPPTNTSKRVAAALATSPRFIRRLVAERRLPFVKVGRHVRFRRSDVNAFIAAGSVAAVRRK